MTSRRLVALLLGALLLTPACASATDHDSSAPSARTPAEEPAESPKPPVAVHSLTAAEVQQGWWGWAVSAEEERSPVLDTTGRWCAELQRENLWYLAGTTGGKVVERKCTVPVGVPVLFPVVTRFGEATECMDFMDTAKGSATLDDAPLTAEPIGTTPIGLVGVPGNAFGEDIGNTWACGLWVRLDPPAPGSHELTIRGESGAMGFATGVDYHLLVAAPTPTGAV
ncbi:signal protein [Kitasatospora sp. NPDC057692]|uniref:signal protein n=1 Tax=Kitasatospora sp. NPDC057692 TaxID=3346215 RepID=UPI0036A1CA56